MSTNPEGTYRNLPLINLGVSCESCSPKSAMCCRKGVVLALDASEIVLLEEGGSKLRFIDREVVGESPGRHREFYQFLADCANLNPNGSCSVHDNPQKKPKACNDFRMGGEPCQRLQLEAGGTLPDPTEALLRVKFGIELPSDDNR